MKRLVHNRGISIQALDLGDHCILVEGALIDHKYEQGHDEASEEPELVHHMVIRLKIRGPGLLIEQAEAEMPHYPKEEYQVVLPWIRNLEGLRIAPGYSMRVKKVIGGTKGCAHLTSLVIAMGESAVQGYWVAYRKERKRMGRREQGVTNIINTCYLWREDGPIVKELLEASKHEAP
jgi:hypothetical protein